MALSPHPHDENHKKVKAEIDKLTKKGGGEAKSELKIKHNIDVDGKVPVIASSDAKTPLRNRD